jgi:NADH-ubiquinone oxidoreductase chain 2
LIISLLILLLLSNAVTSRQDKSILFSRVVITSLIYSSFLGFNNLYFKPLEKGVGIYGGLFNVTTFTQTFNIFIIIVSALILTLTAFYPRKANIQNDYSLYSLFTSKIVYDKYFISDRNGSQFYIIEYALIIVFILCGALFLISTGDLISVFLSIELQSYGLYILSTLYRDSEYATSSGLTYFLLGGLSSCFILLGSALIYANSGTTNLDNIYIIASISEIAELPGVIYWYQPYYLHLSLIIMSVGFLFKVSAAPFHFWSPDVYDGIPTIVTTYVAIVAKISIFAFLLELIYYTEYSIIDFSWKSILLLSSLFSLIIGSVLGLTQSRIKRLFAYSTISHVGFILLALSINSAESIQSYIFYILQYSLSNLNAFIILVSMGFILHFYVDRERVYNNFIDKKNSPIQFINQIKGYFYINPYISISLAITLFSFVGVPPIVGFFAKQMILSAALDSGYIFMSLVAILTSVIGAGYYLNLIKQIFFEKTNYQIHPDIEPKDKRAILSSVMDNNSISQPNQNKLTVLNPEKDITINSSLSTIISVLSLLLVLFIFTPGEWFNIVSILSIILFKA